MSIEDCERESKDSSEDLINSLAECLTVHKIADNKLKELERLLLDDKEIHLLKSAELDEKKNLAEDYEAIVRKQLQILQADERGRIALEKEIENIEGQQQKRSEALKARKKALLIEKARAKKMASRPPPLPKSVVMLLKEQERKEAESSYELFIMPSQVLEDENEEFENEENILNEEEMEEKRKLQEMWDRNAKKRFNEAIKKERQKQENAEILKEIQNAEKVNRRHLAKSVFAKGGNVPCQPPDSIFHSAKQVAMENKVEKIFKKNPKEHAIEELEGYEDRFEAKYKAIDSNLEARLIDCVPSFVKENYNYLLEDESSLNCGRRFTGFQNEEDPLNVGFITSPPVNREDPLNSGFIASSPLNEEMERSKEVEDIINSLNKMHRETNEMIEKEFKPLLTIKDSPKVESVDKSVEANILKLPTEHKSTEVDTGAIYQDPFEINSSDFMSRGVMNFKPKSCRPLFEYPGNAVRRFLSPPKVKQDSGKNTGQESWSSSSYWSLPSKHGMPSACNLCDSPTCKIPLVQDEKSTCTCIPLAKSKACTDPGSSALDESENQDSSQHVSSIFNTPENNFSHYVKIVAEKYLKNASNVQVEHSNSVKESSESYSEPKQVSLSSSPVGHRNSFSFEYAEMDHETKYEKANPDCETPFDYGYSVPESPICPPNVSMDASAEDDFVQKCHEMMSNNLSDAFPQIAPSAEDAYSSDKAQTNPFHPARMVYHELSTIQEMDSALTNDSNHKMSLEQRSRSFERRKSSQSEGKADLSINTTPVSLIEEPPEEVAKLAKSIKFVEKKSPIKPSSGGFRAEERLTYKSMMAASPDKGKSQPSSQGSGLSEISAVSSLASNFITPLSVCTNNLSLGSYGNLTPSVSAQPSPLSVGSQGGNFASSSPFKSQNQVSSLVSLPKYFQNVSSIHKGSNSSLSSQPGSSQSSRTVASERNHAQFLGSFGGKQSQASDTAGSFAPMSPHSCLSSPSEAGFEKAQETENKSQRPPQFVFPNSKLQSTNQSTNFQPMTPRSCNSSWHTLSSKDDISIQQNQYEWKQSDKLPSQVRIHSDQKFDIEDGATSHSQNTNEFHYLTPHTYLPSFSEQETPYSSDFSTPSQREFAPREEGMSLTPELTSPYNFYPKRKKPTYNLKSKVINSIRSPSKSNNCSSQPNLLLSEVKSFLKQNISSDILLPSNQAVCTPVKVKVNFRTHSFRSHDAKDVFESENNCPSPRHDKDDTIKNLEAISPKSPEKDFKGAAKSVGSEAFIPTLTLKDFDLPSTLVAISQIKDIKADVPKSNTLSQMTKRNAVLSPTSMNKRNSPLSQEKTEFTEKPLAISQLPIKPIPISEASKKSISESPAHNFSLYNTPSRTTFQSSTKTLEEMMMETEIFNEPDLTLVNSEFTIHPGSPEKLMPPENNQRNAEPSTSLGPNSSFLTPAKRTVLENVCDSPSMLSFLQHEHSCLQAADSTDQDIPKNGCMEKIEASPSSAKKRTPRNEYKTRTKRLWNNLEEVKERKLMKEKREEIMKNRMKMKAYSKKFHTNKK